ncbi:hypothetical protein [Caballeronia humi]|uniref:Uncharacterized protein n=1 Tax=Caballeronia humi TaxID=326474 RepID=A0A158J0E3_9BURK|nr:hypothetical protein [Caballeronia humi]SAL62412.1 hypothetical protein AWB65_05732 [Caballeronia humi]
MTRSDSTLWIYVQPDGRWCGHYVDAYRAFDIARDCVSPEVVEAAVVDGLGVRPTRIDVEPLDIGEPSKQSDAQPLTLAYEQRMLATANRHIGAARALIRALEDRLATLARDGHDTARGDRLLGFSAKRCGRWSNTAPAHRRTHCAPSTRRDQVQAGDA